MTVVWQDVGLPPLKAMAGAQATYALIDAAQVAEFGRWALPADSHAVLGDELAPDRRDATPHVVALGDGSRLARLLEDLASRATSHGAMSVLVSSLEPIALVDALARRMEVRLPDDVDFTNRYYDGRVAPHLMRVLEAGQRAAFGAFAAQWWVVAHDHRWLALDVREVVPDPFAPPLRLNAEQQGMLVDACYPYTIIDHFDLTDPELLDRVPPAARYRWFARALEVARAYGIDDGPQSVLFCTLTMTRGEQFYDKPRWREGLSRLRRGEVHFRDLMKAIDD